MSTSSSGLVSGGTALVAGTSYTSGQGINVSATVTAILTAKREPETAWTDDETTISNQLTELNTLQTEASSLQSAFQSLSDYTGVFSGMTATSSNSAEVSATASSSAIAGSYNVVVSSLASTGVSYSNSLTSTTISSGALVFSIGSGSAQTINIPESTTGSGTTTLSAAASYINTQNLGVSASVITDTNGSRLVLTSSSSGSAASVNVTSAPSGLSFTNQAGTDASLTVNGVPITSSSNQVTTAISGVTLSLAGTTGSSGASVVVGADTSSITSAISSFISAYNTVVTDLNNQFQYNGGTTTNASTTATATNGVLEDDPTARVLQEQMLSIISVAGTDGSSTTYNSLASLGITMGNDGTLSLNSTTLQSALQSNYSDVQKFFQSTGGATFSEQFNTLMTNLNNPSDGAITLDISGLKSNYATDKKNVSDLEATLSDLQTTLTNQYAALNTTLQMYPTTLLQIETLLGYRATTTSSSGS
ncbi:MAG: flagellar filament capping protein FliD [Acidobacteriota bacterium]|nr:flagellar filament capping protein FliD [Acidobacteriota bacterium]